MIVRTMQDHGVCFLNLNSTLAKNYLVLCVTLGTCSIYMEHRVEPLY